MFNRWRCKDFFFTSYAAAGIRTCVSRVEPPRDLLKDALPTEPPGRGLIKLGFAGNAFNQSVFWWCCKSCESLTTCSSHLRSASQPDGELRRHHVCQHPPSPGQAGNEHGPEVRLRLRLLQGDSFTLA